MATQLALCVALLEKMNEAIETEIPDRQGWKAGVRKLLPELVQTYQDSKTLCDLVGTTIDRPASKENA